MIDTIGESDELEEGLCLCFWQFDPAPSEGNI